MENKLDLSRWRETPRGVGYRRWTIVSAGLRQLLRTRFLRVLLVVAWSMGLAIAAAGFVLSQSLATGGWLETAAAHINARAEALVSVLGAFVVAYPDVCIGGYFTTLLWLHSFIGLWLSLLALAAVVPQLIARDRASNALTAYLSRPLTSADYLLGKLGIVAGVLALLWTGPLLFGWVVSMAFATDRDFIVYSLAPLLRALAFNGVALVALATIALGVSALGRSSRTAILMWIGLWLFFGFVAAPPRAPLWIKRASFTHDLGEVRQEVFRLDRALGAAAEGLPLLDRQFAANLAGAASAAQPADFSGALASLALLGGAASLVFLRKLRPE
jgi:hypothetical protein